ncbi:MAG: hypothetical protein IK080_04610 [Clostridia bacterium]|nr:hypothetical protein [Clostridia bacterium]
MSEISALPASLVDWLSEREELAGIRFLTEYPAIKKAIPLRHTTVAVGIGSMEITDSFTEDGNGVLVENEYCRQVLIRIKLSIHAPFDAGGSACHDAFTDIIDCLSFDSDLEIVESGCNGITADRDTDAFVLDAFMLVRASLCPAESSSLVLPSFFSKTLLCASHINDESIHLTGAQQTYLSQPFQTGSYFGTGDSSRSFSLGYAPKAVFVFAAGLPLFEDADAAATGVGLASGCSLGITLTATGFRVAQVDQAPPGETAPQFNRLGVTYCYIAFR